MTRTLPLRDRLALWFALALVVAYAFIATCAVIVVDRSITRAIDGRIATVGDATFTIAGDERDEIDRKDRQQFAAITADASGALVIGSDGVPLLGTTATVPAWAMNAARYARSGMSTTTDAGGHGVRAIVERRRSHGRTNTIVVWQSMQLVRDVERIVVLVLGGFGVAVAAGGYAVGAQIARRGLLPLTQITAVMADIAGSDLTRRLAAQRHDDELGRLAETFNRMLDRLEAAFERQRRFTADASHDLRAPLATLRAEVDLALRRERTGQQYRDALSAVAGDADNLDRLIDALLAAARSDAGDLDLRRLDLAEIAQAAVDQIGPFARAKHVVIATDLAAEMRIVGDAELLGRAILAVLHNAVKFSPAGATISLSGANDAGMATLVIRDEGPGLSDSALVHAFDRFWRDDTARGRSGTGLGLAIAQAIVQRCGGEIVLSNAPAGGAIVTFRLRAASRTGHDPRDMPARETDAARTKAWPHGNAAAGR